ncbi:BatD family protein [Flavobacterium beibuense]|uniref:BatD protein n=1 Tax=Flavobacterium beibuense TaxID=657326 RepID=A0A444W701_9FLAO|nr:BatD family protein [Flavobacterium beibuense]RYJ41458.1 BatD protein [Flavobacterium beibuense]
MKRYILLIFLFLIQGIYAQDVEFKAEPSKTRLGVNERLRVSFTMNKDGDNFVPPSFDGFRAQGPMQNIRNSWVNGKHTYSKSYDYILTPTSKGDFTIGQASIEIEGKIYKTLPIKISVGDAVKIQDPYEAARQSATEGVHLVAEVSKTNPYVNEPVSVVYKLYVSQSSDVTNFFVKENPSFNDFWSQTDRFDPQHLTIEKGMYNGEMYRYVVLQKTVLYPQKSGQLELEPLLVNATLQVPTGRNRFGMVNYVSEDKLLSSGTRTINVKPLPETGKPDNFTGAVGSFDFSVTPSKTSLETGESLQLDVTVSGKGNLKLFTLPKPIVPSALEMYDPEHKENVNVPISGMTGKISDIYTIVPQNRGKYPINQLSFSYFDPSTGKYKTITSKDLMIEVTGDAVATTTPAATAGTQKQTVESKEQFRFVDLETKLVPRERDHFFGSTLFYGLLAAPFLIIPLIVLGKRKKEAYDSDVVGNKIRQNNRLAKKYLSAAKKQLGNKEEFYVALEKALHNFLKAKLNIETSEMSKQNIQELLLNRKANQETVADFIRIMDSCEFARYAPSSGAAMQQDYESAVSVITALEKQV